MIRATLAGVCLFPLVAGAGAGESFDTSPQAVEPLAALAEFRESDFGAGPLEKPGRTFHVSPKGSDAASGQSWDAAWQTLRRGIKELQPGDTLLVDDGVYYEPQTLTLGKVSGEPGRPIRIFAAPRGRAIITGARRVEGWAPAQAAPRAWAAPFDADTAEAAWETDTRIQLQYAGSLERVNDLPGTFWFDKENKRLYFRPSDSRLPPGRAVAVRGPLHGLSVETGYVHVRGLWFEGYSEGLFVGGRGNGCHHVTVEQCAFYANDMAGLNLMGARHCLIKNNTGRKSGERGVIFTQRMNFNTAGLDNNLIIGNVLHAEPPSVRSGAILHYYAIHHWAGVPSRTYVIDNVLHGALSLWWKPLGPGIVVQGNVMTGSFDTTGSLHLKPDERIVVRHNTMLGSMAWPGETWGPGPGADWVAPGKALVNNLCARGAEALAAARFADPAWLDFRLQPDSPHRAKGVKGVDRGAFPRAQGRVFYVATTGDDAADGATDKTPFKTLRKAASALQAGDTLYIAQGAYDEPLVVAASGGEGRPVRVRSLGKKRVTLPGVEIAGSHVVLEKMVVQGARADGVSVKGNDVALEGCLIHGCKAAGVRGQGAARLAVRHCTIADNAVGLALDDKSVEAEMRDSVVTGGAQMAAEARSSLRAGQGFYKSLASDIHSPAGEPGFVNPAKGDYRLAWDSPAANLAAFGEPAGSEGVAPRPIAIAGPTAQAVTDDSAIVVWSTPDDDTWGAVEYKPVAEGVWQKIEDPEQGELHGAGLVNLKPDTEYEVRVTVRGRRGGEAASAPARFRTSGQRLPARTYYIKPSGDDGADGLSPATAWRTVRRACLAVAPGDTVVLGAGTYGHAIVPLRGGAKGRRVTFRGETPGAARLFGAGVVAPLVRLHELSHVTIQALSFDIGAGVIPPGFMAPHLSPGGVFALSRCKDIEILNCRAGAAAPLGGGLGSDTLSASECEDVRFEDNVSWGARYHVRVGDCKRLVVRNNTFVESRIQPCVVDGKTVETSIVNNIWFRPSGATTKNNPYYLIRGGPKGGVTSDYNVLFSPVPSHTRIGVVTNAIREPLITADDLDTWRRETGQDKHSVAVDPMFEDLAKGDLRLKPGSPARTAGEGGAPAGARSLAR